MYIKRHECRNVKRAKKERKKERKNGKEEKSALWFRVSFFAFGFASFPPFSSLFFAGAVPSLSASARMQCFCVVRFLFFGC
jgi:hypothetical protein